MDLPHEKGYVCRLQVGDPDQIVLRKGDIAQNVHTDAVVNAANSELLAGAGVCGAIYRAAGPAIADECRHIRFTHGRLPPGQAVATTAGLLPCKHVIHTVGPIWNGGENGEAGVLADCYRESMRIADEANLHSIAFPAISTGVFGYPVEQAARIALPTLIESLRTAKHLVLVEVVLFDRKTLDTFAAVAHAQREQGLGNQYEIWIGIIE
jgi:O-acetyl-ADP-ribose deacetylase (regulator of RNase III)